MSTNAGYIAQLDLKQQVTLAGDLERRLLGAVPISRPAPEQLSFIRSKEALERLELGSVDQMTLVCNPDTASVLTSKNNTLVITNEPRLVFLRIVSQLFVPPNPTSSIHPSAVVDKTAEIDSTAFIGAGCYIGPHSRIGASCVLQPNVTIYANVTVGKNVIINSGTVIGSDGFGYERNEFGVMEKFPHLGGVIINDDVEIGTNTSIDRGTLDDTVIGPGVKIDNQCHIAHNVIIHENSVVIANSMLAGSVKVGKRAWISPSACILNQLSIGDDSTVGIGSVVLSSVDSGVTVSGWPARRLSR